jgi:alkylresorcinol/alkylpyrone synthase
MDYTIREVRAALPPAEAARITQIVESSGNDTRYLVKPPDDVRKLQSIAERNREYVRFALPLGERVARQALAAADIDPGSVTAIIGISSTGHLMPTLETHLRDRLALPRRCRRLPLNNLGCAGGGAGIGLAATLANAGETVLVVTVELPSLSCPNLEASFIDCIAATQYGDGAAAAVISGRTSTPSPKILGSASLALADGLQERSEVQLTADGLRLRPVGGLADVLRRQLGNEVAQFLDTQGIAPHSLAFWAIHPRNGELLSAVGDGVGVGEAQLAASRAVWRRCGSLVSAAVFHVLRELADTTPPSPESLGLLISYGAGYTSELVLLRAGGWLCPPATHR